ncbi:MAG: polyprenyl synthetase family protein [Bacteroidota bacterium]
MRNISEYQEIFNSYLAAKSFDQEPSTLYEPINYIMSLGGKRLRPVLTLMTADLFGGDCTKALNAAMCIEVFHNFSLIHDDIMDDAPLRRGKQTVHEKWDVNTGILSGDAMLILASSFLESYNCITFKSLMSLFNATAIEVCEGQQYDINFETRDDVTEEQYLKMIAYKTAVLVGAAMKMGAIIAGASDSDSDAIYKFGMFLGTAFQLQDDYLDAFGDPKTFGKQIGGDIIEHKKTFLYLKALSLSDDSTSKKFLSLMSDDTLDSEFKVQEVKKIYKHTGAKEATSNAVENFTNRAFKVLDDLNITEDKKDVFRSFGQHLMKRTV